ncbi:MAG: RagB/SusD family nutrient uptake outer membrane protein [Bacteroidetes bacterium]|nr:RagB/SusD family nutrient uptake outer membrane protein [Bacteroidota bacterium]
MKKLIYIFSVLSFILFIAPACNKKLDVLPQNSVTPDQIKTSSDVEALLFGGYELLQNYGAFGEQFMLIPDLLASQNQVDWVGTYYEYGDVQNKVIVSNNSIPQSIWSNGYDIINIANTVLDKLSIVDSADKATVEGEAKFLRGTIYFELVGLFGKPYSDGNASSNLGVPIVLLPTYDYDSTKNKPARAAVTDVYTQVIADLQDAIGKLPSTNANFRADMYSAKAILSRVYLSMGDYTNAATQANDVIESGNFRLTDTYDKAFNNNSNSSEDIFAIQETNQSNVGTNNQGIATFYCPHAGLPAGQPVGRGDAQIDPGYFDYFEPADFRGTFYTQGTSIAGEDGNYTNKWQFFYKAIPVVRLAEMYLTRGEANLMLGGAPIGGVTPLADINMIRQRSGASTLGSVAASDFIDERFRELGFEGDRYWTLRRTKNDIDGLGYDDNALILPIPQREIDVNQNLVQNAGY